LAKGVQPPQAFIGPASAQTTSSVPAQVQVPPPHEPHPASGAALSVVQPPQALRAVAPTHATSSFPAQPYLPPQRHPASGAWVNTEHPPHAFPTGQLSASAAPSVWKELASTVASPLAVS
jgi:hypothetical protein